MKKINTLLEVDLMKLSEFPELRQIIEEVQTDYQKAENKEMYVEISKQSIDDIIGMLSQIAPDALPNQETAKKKQPDKKTEPAASSKKPTAMPNVKSASEKEMELTKALEECQKENQETKKKKSTSVTTNSTKSGKSKESEASNINRSKAQKTKSESASKPDDKGGIKTSAKSSAKASAMKMDEELIKDKIEQHLLAIIKIPGLKPFTTPAKAEQLKKITIIYFNELLPALGLKSLKRDQKTFEKLIDELLEKHGASHIKQLASQWQDEMPEIDFIEKHEKKFYNQRLTDESKNILSILKKANSLLSQNMAGAAAEYLAEHLSGEQIEAYLPAYIKQLF